MGGRTERPALGSGRSREGGGAERAGQEKREREKEREKKRKERENGKRKEKEKGGERKREKGERERFAVIPPVATATPVGHARLSRPQAAARREARVEGKNRVLDTGVGSLGKTEDLAEQGGSRKLGLGFQGGISSSTTKQNFSARFV